MKDFFVDFQNNRIKGYIKGIDAIKQIIIFILSTERYAYLTHSWQYGASIDKYIGQDYNYIVSDIEREIKESLLMDDRILDVNNFNLNKKNDEMYINFNVETLFGNTDMEVELVV